jgi:hypothetical protein
VSQQKNLCWKNVSEGVKVFFLISVTQLQMFANCATTTEQEGIRKKGV